MTRGTRILAATAVLFILPLLFANGTINAQDYGDPGMDRQESTGLCPEDVHPFTCLLIKLWNIRTYHEQLYSDRSSRSTGRPTPSYQLVSQPSPLPIDPRQLSGLDLMYWDTGAVVSQTDRSKGLDIVTTLISIDRNGFAIEFRTEPAALQTFPFFYRLAFDLPNARGGGQNRFAGPGFEEDVMIQVRVDAPGRYSLSAVVAGRERQMRGTAQPVESGIRITLPVATVAELGAAIPGVRAVFGTVGPSPERIYDRVPERGALQIGLPNRDVLEPTASLVKAKFDLNGDGKDDLFYLDTNGNGQIDGVALDRNNDGRIALSLLEGPGLFVGADGAPMEFAQVVRQVAGGQQRYVLENAQMVYVTVFEDKNGDRRFDDAGEFESYGAQK
jgi:hypothetical protein